MLESRGYNRKVVAKAKGACAFNGNSNSQQRALVESIEKNSELKELFDKVMKGSDKELERRFFSYGFKVLPYLFEAFCSENEGARFRSISLLAKLMPWEIIDSVRERFKGGGLRLTEKEKEIIQKNLNRYLEAGSL